MHVIGLDLGGTKLAGAIFSLSGEIIIKKSELLNDRKGKDVTLLINSFIGDFADYASENNLSLTSVGISVPGIAWHTTGNVWAPNIPGWENYPLKSEVELFFDNKYKVKIDSDRACYILGERWQGAARNCKNAVYLAVGTGIGAGILIDDIVLRGSNDIAGAIGWMALNKPFEPKYIPCGCFEYYASGEGLAKYAKELLTSMQEYKGVLRKIPVESIKSKDIFEHFENNDEIAIKTIQNAIEYWGMAAANLVSLFNPEKIIFGGGVFGPAIKFLDKIYLESKKWAQPISINQVTFEPSELGSDAGLIGAGYLALKN